jgi:hypothetical protein
MSLAGFQLALADLISSPDRCLAARAQPDAVLSGYDLNARERRRIAEVVRQRGMSTNCSLYRSNRVTPIYTLLHFSCLALGTRLEAELNAYWRSVEFSDLQFQLEIERFARFLERRVADGALPEHWLPSLLNFELASNALRFAPRRQLLAEQLENAGSALDAPLHLSPLVRLVRFSCDASALFDSLSRAGALQVTLPKGESYLLLSVLRNAVPEVIFLDPAVGSALLRLRCGDGLVECAEVRASLVEMGVVTQRRRAHDLATGL